MKRVALFFAVGVALLVSGCHKTSTPEGAAKVYIHYLIDEDAARYAKAMARYDSLPDNVRQETVRMVKQFMVREQQERGGVKSAKVSEVAVKDDIANVRLSLEYGDESVEEIMMALVLVEGKWRLI